MTLTQIATGRWPDDSCRVRAILRERAKELARAALPTAEAQGAAVEVVTFGVSHDVYGVEWRWVYQVFRSKIITPLPGAPAHLAGITNVRGQILPVVDLKTYFELPSNDPTDLTWLVILGEDQPQLGILADRLLGFQSLAPATFDSPPATFADVHVEFLQAVAPGPVMILDAKKIFDFVSKGARLRNELSEDSQK